MNVKLLFFSYAELHSYIQTRYRALKMFLCVVRYLICSRLLAYSITRSLARLFVRFQYLHGFCFSENSQKTDTLHKKHHHIAADNKEINENTIYKKKENIVVWYLRCFSTVHFICLLLIVIQCAKIGLCYGHTQSVIWFSSTRSSFERVLVSRSCSFIFRT